MNILLLGAQGRLGWELGSSLAPLGRIFPFGHHQADLTDPAKLEKLVHRTKPQIIVNATLEVGDVILFESALSFLGLGVSPPYSTWGIMVNSVNDVFTMLDCLYVWIPPGVCILLTVMAINFVGDGLRDAFDPKMRR